MVSDTLDLDVSTLEAPEDLVAFVVKTNERLPRAAIDAIRASIHDAIPEKWRHVPVLVLPAGMKVDLLRWPPQAVASNEPTQLEVQ